MDDMKVEDILGFNNDPSEVRLRICHKCPIYSPKYGGMCNNKLWLNPDTGDVSTKAKPNYKRGCGCLLEPKVSIPIASCPVDKW